MARTTINYRGKTLTISPDNRVPPASRPQVLAHGRAIDELTRKPAKAELSVHAPKEGIQALVKTDGIIGFMGRPGEVFPKLDTNGYTFSARLRAEGYIPRNILVDIPSNSGFPDTFHPVDMGTVELHREPVFVAGRVLKKTGNVVAAVPNSAVAVTRIWLRTGNLNQQGVPPGLIALHPPLNADRPGGITHLRRRPMSLAQNSKRLAARAAKGSARIVITDREGLNSSDILAIGTDEPGRVEFMEVKSIQGRAQPGLPATVTLFWPLAYSHAADSLVQKALPQQTGAARQLDTDAIAGDTCISISNTQGLDTAPVAVVSGGVDPVDSSPLPDEYHIVSSLGAVSGQDGFYRLPPISRAVQINVRADDGANQIEKTLMIDYSKRANNLDIVF